MMIAARISDSRSHSGSPDFLMVLARLLQYDAPPIGTSRTLKEVLEAAPALFDAFFTPRPQASASTDDGRAALERRLRKHLSELLWMHPRGLHVRMLWRVLHGEDWWFDQRRNRWRRLWPSLLYHRSRGTMRGIRPRAIDRVLELMVESGDVVAQVTAFTDLPRTSKRMLLALNALNALPSRPGQFNE